MITNLAAERASNTPLKGATGNSLIALVSFGQLVATRLTGGNAAENGMYLGLPLIVLHIGFVIFLRPNRAVLVTGAMAFISYVLSLGPYLYVDGHNTGIVMPEYVLSKLGLQDILAVRLSLFTACSSPGLFGPPVSVAEGAPLLDRLIGLTGRDPDGRPYVSGERQS